MRVYHFVAPTYGTERWLTINNDHITITDGSRTTLFSPGRDFAAQMLRLWRTTPRGTLTREKNA